MSFARPLSSLSSTRVNSFFVLALLGAATACSSSETTGSGGASSASTNTSTSSQGVTTSSNASSTSTGTGGQSAGFTIGGTVSGLSASGLVLRNNGGDDLAVAAQSASFTFATHLADNASYGVTIQTQPAGLACAVTNSSGTVMGADVSNVDVHCAPSLNQWTWVNGQNVTNATAVYGQQGVAAATNNPGARYASAAWADQNGALWLFGGAPTGGGPKLGDLWKFDGTDWTWVLGSNQSNASGVYGSLGVAAAGNTPGARYFTSAWTDSAHHFWLFGGRGYDSVGSQGALDDLWKFDGTQWTWIGGSKTAGSSVVYGTKGVAASGNTPGGRYRAVSWIDNNAHAFVFGGLDASGNALSDLWKFDGTNWVWVSGSNTPNASGVYGTLGTANAANAPGARQDSTSWVDSQGELWMFGGYGYDSAGQQTDLDDLWKFDGTQWTWVSGSNLGDAMPSYGTKGVASPTNGPGARENAIAWPDPSGAMWLMSGTHSHDVGELNDLWKFDGASWTWVSGGNAIDSLGTYGPLGMPGTSYAPGGRDSAIAWSVPNGDLWLFGGWGFGTSGSASDMNDLWRYQR